ncbi:bifunctional purine biosynthesis protein PurH [Clostridia bacterium]|nr:bifunctional purine biosynthesis protein PurH [Clostridia bacterium]
MSKVIGKALISVSDKSGVVEFAKELKELGYEIISTGGTAVSLSNAGITVTGISEITGFPECLDGRVKTLHPAVHGGILAIRDNPDHMKQLEDLNIQTIDIVAINLYPFKETILKPGVTLAEAIENIDIGGPTMLRSAAKNHRDVAVICDPADYLSVLEEIKNGGITTESKFRLALKVFQHTAAYDALIADYLRAEIGGELPDKLTLTFEKLQSLRYGENPHQKAYYYREVKIWDGALAGAEQIHGKELSFNNINDTNGALDTLAEFDLPAVVAVKHANPCGVALADSISEAYKKTYEADPISIFGGIIAANRPVDKSMADEINKIFIEIVIAPDFTEEALEVLTRKKNIRLLKLKGIGTAAPSGSVDIKKVSGGLLIQDTDGTLFNEEDWKLVTKKEPNESEKKDMIFGMKVVKHIRSNGIVIVKDGMTLGVGPGQTNRIWAVENAIRQAIRAGFDLHGAVLASDAFFPFDDCVEAAAEAGISAIIQPGGSVNDDLSVAKADEKGIAMVFSGMRHFKH